MLFCPCRIGPTLKKRARQVEFFIGELSHDAAPRQDLAPVGQGKTWQVQSLKFSKVPSSLHALKADDSVHYALLTVSENRLQANFRLKALLFWMFSQWAIEFNKLLQPRFPVIFPLSTTILLSSDSASGSNRVGLVHQLPPSYSEFSSADAEEIKSCSRAFQLFVLLQTDGAACCTLPQYLGGLWQQPDLHSDDMRFGEDDQGPPAIEVILAEHALCAPAPVLDGSVVAGRETPHHSSTTSNCAIAPQAARTRREGASGVNLSDLPNRSSLLMQRHPSAAAITKVTCEVTPLDLLSYHAQQSLALLLAPLNSMLIYVFSCRLTRKTQ